MIRLLLLVLLVFTNSSKADEEISVASSSHENSVVGNPYVNCAADAVYLKFKTNVTFEGHVNVKYTPNKYCYQVLVTNNQIEVLIPHEDCSVTRRRSFNPLGIIMEVTMSVSFHPEFTTVNDKVFHFNCFHIQKPKGHGLETGSPTVPPPAASSVPKCRYSILQSAGGRPVGTVAMGQQVFHEWACEDVTDSCLLVRNCVLVAGQTRHSLIGEDGCSRDTKILPNLEYLNQTYISQNVSVFGVSTASLIYFECEVQLIPSQGACEQPTCLDSKRKRRNNELEHSSSIMDVRSQRIEISELDAPPETPDEPIELAKCEESQPHIAEAEELCVSLSTFAMSLSLIVCIALFVVFLASVALLQRYKYYNVANNSS